jgi:hypothetical protein
MGIGVDVLHEAISAVAAVDLAALDAASLDEHVIQLHRELHRLSAAVAEATARWEQCGVWAGDGSRSPSARLARDAGIAPHTAKRHLARGHALLLMPRTAAALAEGRLSMDHVDLLAAVDTPERHELFLHDEHLLVEQCASLRYRQARRLLEYWQLHTDSLLGVEPGCDDDASRLYASVTFGGSVRIDGTLDAVDGEQFLTELRRLEREQYLADKEAGVSRTPAMRRAAALVEMARRSAAVPQGARRPRALLTVLVGADRFAELCETATGTVLRPDQVLPHLGTADLETILFDDDLTALAVSTRRTFTGRLRRAIEARDQHCQHPSGCDVPAPDCDVDHVVPPGRGGPTSQANGRLECRPHNRDATRHDHGARPRPERRITPEDIARARRRWHEREADRRWAAWAVRVTRFAEAA